LALSYQLGENLPDWDDLPDDVIELLDESEDGELDALSVAKIANAMIAAAEFDKQEPSYAVLGRNIEAWNVMHVYQRAFFSKYTIGTNVGDLIQRMEPAAPQEYAKALKDYHFKGGNFFSTYQLLSKVNGNTPLANMPTHRASRKVLDSSTFWEHRWCYWVRDARPGDFRSLRLMKWISRDSPVLIASLLRLDWENNKQNFEKWIEKFKEHPIIALTAARVLKKQDGNLDRATKHYNRFLEMSPDAKIIREFAKAQYHEDKKSDAWLITLKRTFDCEDLGLDHASAASKIAWNLMHEGDFEGALPWAKRANQSGSSFGME